MMGTLVICMTNNTTDTSTPHVSLIYV